MTRNDNNIPHMNNLASSSSLKDEDALNKFL
jgi:hypothetical protein